MRGVFVPVWVDLALSLVLMTLFYRPSVQRPTGDTRQGPEEVFWCAAEIAALARARTS